MGPVSRQLRFGYKVSAEQFSPADLLEFTVVAEQCGFDTAAISDHFQPWRHTGGHAPFSLSWLGAAGQATSSIELGTSEDPQRDAEAAATTAGTPRLDPRGLGEPIGIGRGRVPTTIA